MSLEIKARKLNDFQCVVVLVNFLTVKMTRFPGSEFVRIESQIAPTCWRHSVLCKFIKSERFDIDDDPLGYFANVLLFRDTTKATTTNQ